MAVMSLTFATPTPIHLHPYEILNYFLFIKKDQDLDKFRLVTAMHRNGPLPQVDRSGRYSPGNGF
jgi:hypothetical protein